MITSISTNFSIRADKEYKRYQVKCSTGDTIPLGSNGKPKGNVVLTFYKTGTEGEMTAVSAASVNVRRNATDGRYSMFSGIGSSLDITTNLNSFIDQYGGLASIEVTMLDSVGGSVLAVQSFGAVKDGTNGTNGTNGTDGADGVSYAILLSTGATVPCTSDAELKAEALTLQLLKDGAAVTFSPTVTILSAANDVLATYSMQQDTYSTHNITLLFTSTIKHGTVNPVAPQSISVTARVGGKTVAVQRFNVVYDSPTPFVRKETVWSSGLTFHNGDIILLGGKVDNGNVFSWRCPVSGNSNEIPSLDVSNNPSTTNWVQFSYFNMVATNLLLASYALIENLGVGAVEMKNSAGETVFYAKGGSVKCDTGTFNNVDIASGKIGGFTINKNMLLYNAAGEMSQLSWGGYTYSTSATNSTTYVNVGDEAVAYESAGVVVKRTGANQGYHYGVYSDVKGGKYNMAFFGVGNVATDGFCCGFAMANLNPSSSTTLSSMTKLDISQAAYFTVTSNPSGGGRIVLPTYSELLAALGVGSSSRFLCMEITVTSIAASGECLLYGRNSTISGMNTSQYPEFHNGGTGAITSLGVSKGDVVKILLFYRSGYYYAHVVSRIV